MPEPVLLLPSRPMRGAVAALRRAFAAAALRRAFAAAALRRTLAAAAFLGTGVVGAGLVAALAPARLRAQSDDPRAVPVQPQVEWRLEGVAADAPAALAGVGVNLRAGWYVRAGASLAGGALWPEQGPRAGLVRIDARMHFHLDPFAERARGLYVGGGLSASHAGAGIGARPPVLLLLAGIESRPRRGRAWALELGVGGGVRLGLARRSARPDGYR